MIHPAILALPIAAVIILLLPDIFDKYNVSLVNEIPMSDKEARGYFDLDHDGYSEMLAAGPDNAGGSGIAVYSHDFAASNHWIFNGSFIEKNPFCIIGDYDNDDHDEVYAFTIQNDSVLINSFDDRKYPIFIVHDRFVTRIKEFNGTIDTRFAPVTITDLTGDGYKEVVFQIITGWAAVPRRIFAYDVKHDSIFCSPELGGSGNVTDIADIDGDGKMEFAFTNYGTGNIRDKNLSMQDSCAYVIALDHNLQFLFTPIANPGKYNSVTNFFMKRNDGFFLLSFWTDKFQTNKYKPIRIFDLKGKLTDEIGVDIKNQTSAMPFIKVKKKDGTSDFLLISLHEDSRIFNERLLLKGTVWPAFVNYNCSRFDFDYDGVDELFYGTKNADKWIILRSTFKDPVEIILNNMQPVFQFYTILNGKEKPYVCIESSQKLCILQYGLNNNYYWRYPLNISIYLVTFLFLMIATSLQKKQLRKKLETEKHITELQLSSIHTQMDSHFTFNVMNTIGSAILQEKREVAYDLLTRFSKLLRSTLYDSEKVIRKLEEEVSFVRNFLQIQKSRFHEVFDFEITEDPDIDPTQLIPKGCIQTYVENAIKHGLGVRTAGGKIVVTIRKKDDFIQIIVRDNGIGRQAAALNENSGTGKGLKLMRQYYDILNHNNKEKITETIMDLMGEDGTPGGTEVRISIPQKFDFGTVQSKRDA